MSVSIILLAAGSSQRFGPCNKLLAPLDGVPLVRILAETLAETRAAEIIAVTGADSDGLRHALDGIRVRFADNPDHADGMSRSIAAGIAAVDKHATGALIVPGDMPLIPAGLVDALIAAFEAGGEQRIVFPMTPDGEQRNPVLWPRRLLKELARLEGDKGGKALLEQHHQDCDMLIVDDEQVFRDIDTPDDLALVFERQALQMKLPES